MEMVLGYIERGREEGARILVGGKRRTEGALAKGFFVEPTVFDGCRDDMSIVREEIFGPVMSVLEFERRGRGRRARERDRVRSLGRRLHQRPQPRAPRDREGSRPAPAGSTTTT